jgi:peptidyl-prolyl cis-trans isomerase A (cyclophilin A)
MRSFPVLLMVVAAAACSEKPAQPPPALLSPDPAKVAAPAPDSFIVRFTTSRGAFDVKVHRDWAPLGTDRLYYLVDAGFYDNVRFYRVIERFMAQFGASGDTAVARVWRDRRITDDPVRHRNERGALTFATAGPNTRTTQLFINFGNNQQLDGIGFAPLGEVVSGMPAVDSLYNGYGESAPGGQGPSQGRLQSEGNAYLLREFPKLDYILTARVTEEWGKK